MAVQPHQHKFKLKGTSSYLNFYSFLRSKFCGKWILYLERLIPAGVCHHQWKSSLHPRGSAAFGQQVVENPPASQSGPGPQALFFHTKNLRILIPFILAHSMRTPLTSVLHLKWCKICLTWAIVIKIRMCFFKSSLTWQILPFFNYY